MLPLRHRPLYGVFVHCDIGLDGGLNEAAWTTLAHSSEFPRSMTDVQCVFEMRSILGESPMWHAAQRRLYWLDLQRPAIYRFDPASGRTEQVKAEPGKIGRAHVSSPDTHDPL